MIEGLILEAAQKGEGVNYWVRENFDEKRVVWPKKLAQGEVYFEKVVVVVAVSQQAIGVVWWER